MRRREVIAGLIGAVACPRAARSQQPTKVPRVGLLFYGSPGSSPEVDAFRQGLRELGYTEEQNIAIEYRFASGRVGVYSTLEADFLAELKKAFETGNPDLSILWQKFVAAHTPPNLPEIKSRLILNREGARPGGSRAAAPPMPLGDVSINIRLRGRSVSRPNSLQLAPDHATTKPPDLSAWS
jgi:hypothetical protein